MNYYPPSILNAIKQIAKLPGIGEKTAERLALHLLRTTRNDTEQLAKSILDLKEKVKRCRQCFGLSDSDICQICSNSSRNQAQLCVVEQPADMVSIEKSGAYNGCYHILSGVLSPINGVGPSDIRISELIDRVKSGQIKEIILATGTNVEGEATAAYLADQLGTWPVKVSRIASGVPIGGDLKYVDKVTLKRAMENRHAL